MRKLLFRLMILVVLFLVIVLIVAAKNHTSPKMVIQNRFTRQTISTTTGDTMTGEISNVIPITTGSTEVTLSGELSAEDKAQTEDFINSLIQ